jgi:hypothetical protein
MANAGWTRDSIFRQMKCSDRAALRPLLVCPMLLRRQYKMEHVGTALAVLVVVACTVIILTQRARDVPLNRLLNADKTVSGQLSAYVVFQAADCDTRLDFLALFDRAEIAARVTPRLLLLLGDATEHREAIRQLGPRAHGLPIARADRRLRNALEHLGASGTPIVVVLDQVGAVRFLSPGPRTPPEYIALAHTLTALNVTH